MWYRGRWVGWGEVSHGGRVAGLLCAWMHTARYCTHACDRSRGVAGTFRYAEPSDSDDGLCHKLTALFGLAAEALAVPVQLALLPHLPAPTAAAAADAPPPYAFRPAVLRVNGRGAGELHEWWFAEEARGGRCPLPRAALVRSALDHDVLVALEHVPAAAAAAAPGAGPLQLLPEWLDHELDRLAAAALALATSAAAPADPAAPAAAATAGEAASRAAEQSAWVHGRLATLRAALMQQRAAALGALLDRLERAVHRATRAQQAEHKAAAAAATSAAATGSGTAAAAAAAEAGAAAALSAAVGRLRARLGFLHEQLEAFRRGAQMAVARLSDMRFASRFGCVSVCTRRGAVPVCLPVRGHLGGACC